MRVGDKHYRSAIPGDYAKRMRRKWLGGYHSRNGHDYEDFYSVFKLALCCKEAMQSDKAAEFRLIAGAPALVDDLWIQRPEPKFDTYVQLKTQAGLTWNSFDGDLRKDFLEQAGAIAEANGKDELELVVSDPDSHEDLLKIDRRELDSVLVIPFQTGNAPDGLVSEDFEYKDDFVEALQGVINTVGDDRTYLNVASAFFGAWVGGKRDWTIPNFLARAYECCDKIVLPNSDDQDQLQIGRFIVAWRNGNLVMEIADESVRMNCVMPFAVGSPQWEELIQELEADPEFSAVEVYQLIQDIRWRHAAGVEVAT